MPIKQDDQGQFEDKTIEHPELEQAIAEMFELEAEAKAYGKKRREAHDIIKGLELPAGTRLLVGPYAVEITERRGGGFEVEPWERNVVGKIRQAAE